MEPDVYHSVKQPQPSLADVTRQQFLLSPRKTRPVDPFSLHGVRLQFMTDVPMEGPSLQPVVHVHL